MWCKGLIVFLVGLCVVHLTVAQQGFYRNYGGSGNDYGLGVVETFDKGYAVVGATESFGHGAVDVYLLKIDSLGEYLWSKTFGGPNIEWGHSLKQVTDSGFFLCGYSNSFGVGYDAYVVKTDKLGNEIWSSVVDLGEWEFLYAMTILSNNELLLVGEIIDLSDGLSDGLMIKMDNQGDTLWTRRIGGDWNNRINAVIVNRFGDYMFTGTSQNEEGVWQVWVVKTDDMGEVIWEYFYGLEGEHEAMDIVEMNDGTYLITGNSSGIGTNNMDHLLLKIFDDGTLFFADALNDAEQDMGIKSLQYANQSSFITIGSTNSHGLGGFEIRAAERDNYLNYIGTSVYNNFFGTTKNEWVYSADTTYDKGFVLVGVTESTQFGSVSIVVVKKDSTFYSPEFSDEVFDLSTEYLLDVTDVKCFPNPIKDKLFITTRQDQHIQNYTIYDISGSLMCSGFTHGVIEIDIPSGLYILHLPDLNQYLRFVKE